MSANLASEIWGELRRFVNTVDREEAAETVVAVLIDNDYSADVIRNAFKGDADIKQALAVYAGQIADEEPEEEEEESDTDEDEDERWEN
jgi:hypothetical protein